jgi:hypothetical protein
VKIRLHGTAEECEQAARLLGETLNVVSVSDPYPDRGHSRLVRVYLEVCLVPERAALIPPGRGDAPCPRATLHRSDRELPGR